ncbi:MAG TPA: hypothetical protein VGV14_17150 [Rhodanobacter sp.]|nr:hypothetical protein [Rhodanobacter sp.]
MPVLTGIADYPINRVDELQALRFSGNPAKPPDQLAEASTPGGHQVDPVRDRHSRTRSRAMSTLARIMLPASDSGHSASASGSVAAEMVRIRENLNG